MFLAVQEKKQHYPKQNLCAYVCHLYGYEESADVNYVPYQVLKRGKFNEEILPPNEDSLNQHIRRANFQSYIWCHAVQPILNLLSVSNHGWKIEKDDVVVDRMTMRPAPDSLLETVHCRCTKGCENRKCSCVKSLLKCWDLCHCTN